MRTLFLQVRIPEVQWVEYENGRCFRLSVYLPEGEPTHQVFSSLQSSLSSQIALTRRKLKQADWLEAWKKDIRAFPLTSTLDVVPVWAQKSYRPRRGRRAILLETTLAFGTGLHETTRFMAGMIESCSGQFSSFLDVGTGSGLLAMVAFYCEARQVDILDIDEQCLATAEQNLTGNGLAARQVYRCDFSEFPARKKYDFIAANLFSHDLISLRKKLWQHVNTRKYLAISGISLKNLSDVRQAFATLPLKCRKVRRGRKWAAILYQKISKKDVR